MIPILYDSNETNFTSNGLGRLRDAISVTVVEERNGIYECNFTYPIDGANFDKIKLGRIIGVTHNAVTVPRSIRYRGPITDEESDIITDENDLALTATGMLEVTGHDIQPFDIVSYTRPINGIVEFHAVHISYRQSKMVSYATDINSLADAFQAFDDTCYPSGNPFTYFTDKDSTGYVAAFDGTPRSIRSLLGGVEGSILDAYGGEYEWDKFFVRLHSARGVQRNFSIRYGINMTDFQDDTDYSEAYNTCVPFWKSSDGTTVIGGEVSSGQGTIGNGDKCVPLDLTDKFEEQPTVSDLESLAASLMASNRTYLPSQTIKVDFIRLQDEAGFDQFDSLLQCKLCDSIKVIFPHYGMSAYYKIVKTTWNVLLDRYDEMELGNLSTTLAEALGVSGGFGMSGGESGSADYVVEQATSGIWTYRKWNSGIVECWGTYTETLTSYASFSGLYGYTTSTTFPANLFIARPSAATYNATVGNGFAMAASNIGVSNPTTMTLYALSNVSGTQSCIFDINVIGRWK